MEVQSSGCMHWKPEDWPNHILSPTIRAILVKAILSRGDADEAKGLLPIQEQNPSDAPSTSTFQCLQCAATAICGSQTSKPCCDHAVMVDGHKLELYCQQCRDYIYVQQFDETLTLVSHILSQQTPHSKSCAKRSYIAENDPAADIQAKRQKLLTAATADRCAVNGSSLPAGTSAAASSATASTVADTDVCALDAADTLEAQSSLTTGECRALKSPDGFPLGLRGLNNLGNTCFMNSVLQVMFHTPLLADFFLGDGHDPTTCPLTARDEPCLSCQMESMFSEVYSGNRQPCSPAEFLYQWWRHADSLAGYQQQDAHEFYLSLLEGMSGALLHASTSTQAAALQQTASASQQQPSDGSQPAAQASCTAQQHQHSTHTWNAEAGAGAPIGAAVDQTNQLYSQSLGTGTGTQQALQQHSCALPGTMHGHDMYLQNSYSNGYPDWKQLQVQLLQQQGLLSWPQAYLNQQQQLHHGSPQDVTGQAAVEPLSLGETPGPEGLQDKAAGPGESDEDGVSLVELLFSGLLRSDVRCCACGHTSTAYDPFRDISLDLHVPRPPKLPPLQPLAVSAAAAEATASLRTAAASDRQEHKTPARGVYTTAAFADNSGGGGEYSGGTWAAAGREATPPLLLVTPSPTPPPSDLASDYWDNTEDAADTAAGGPTYSEDISLSAKPTAITAALQAGGDGGMITGVAGQAARPQADGEEVSNWKCRTDAGQAASTRMDTHAAGSIQHGKAQVSCKATEAGSEWTQHSAEPAVRVPVDEEQLTDVMSMGISLSADNEDDASVSDKSPQASEVWGPAGSQSSIQCDGEDRTYCKERGLLQQSQHEHGDHGNADGESSRDTPQRQQQHLKQFQRECTPQSAGLEVLKPQQQQQGAQQQHAVQDAVLHKQGLSAEGGNTVAAAPSGVASSLVRGVVSGGLGHLVRAPVAAIKHLLPGWSSGNDGLQQQSTMASAVSNAERCDLVNDDSAQLIHSQGRQQQGQQVKEARHPQQPLQQHCDQQTPMSPQLQMQHAATDCKEEQHTDGLRMRVADMAPKALSADIASAPVDGKGLSAGAATQPTHPTGGMQLTEQPHLQQIEQQQQQQQQEDDLQHFWRPTAMQHDPQHMQQDWQHQPAATSPLLAATTTAAALKVQHKPRSSPKPGGTTPQELLTAAAVQQGLLKKRDERGRFYRKEHLQAWAQQLYEEGHLKVEGMPEVSVQEAAAARARGLPRPPFWHSAPAGAGPVAVNKTLGNSAAPGGTKLRKTGDVHSGSAAFEYSAAAKKMPPPPQLRMNELSLAGCLRRFVRPERLGAAAHWCCSACGSSAAAMKQMSVRRLPLVLCFHVKRFEHGGSAQRPKKLDVPMRFPLRGLDLSPFTTSGVLRGQEGSGMRAATAAAAAAAAAGQDSEAAPATTAAAETGGDGGYQQKCFYELFGIVSHHGDMSSGHYVSYVKAEGCWYLINDAWVIAVSEADVAQAQAYMLFYAQEHLFGTCGGSGLPSRALQTAALAMQQAAEGRAAV